jgi:hypothetical protein
MHFSHSPNEQGRTTTPVVDETAHENLFLEPDFAPGTTNVLTVEPTPVPVRRGHNGRSGHRQRNGRR